MREITINKAMNGFIVKVGCQTLVFNDVAAMLAEMTRYIAAPQEVEKEYFAKYDPKGVIRQEVTPISTDGPQFYRWADAPTSAPPPAETRGY